MGYMFVFGTCFGCGRAFTFNPDHVPSIPIRKDGTIGADGDRQPICATCIAYANEKRKASGLPLWTVHPDAYEPAESM
jgi:hypothetical protein